MQVSTTSPFTGYAISKNAVTTTASKTTNDNAGAVATKSGTTASSVGFNLSSLLSSEAVKSVLSTQEDGTLAWHDPGRVLTNQESLAWNAVVSQNLPPKENTHNSTAFSDEAKAFIRQTTGFNVITFDSGLQQIVDDQGNLATGPQAMAAAHMAMAMNGEPGVSEGGGLSADFFKNLFDTAAAAGQPYPAGVIAKAKDWFDTLLKTVSNSQDTNQDIAKSQASNAADAYAALNGISTHNASDINSLSLSS